MTKAQKQARFVAMRIEGIPFERIASELQVSRSTLFNWQKNSEVAFEINAGRAAALQRDLHDLGALREQQIRALAEICNRLVESLRERDLSNVAPDKLVKMLFEMNDRMNAAAQPVQVEPGAFDSLLNGLDQTFDPLG